KRCRMPVVADAEEDDVQAIDLESVPFAFEFLGSAGWITDFGLETKQSFRLECLLDHAGVRFRMIDRDIALIHDDPDDRLSSQFIRLAQKLVERLGRRATRKRDRARTAFDALHERASGGATPKPLYELLGQS